MIDEKLETAYERLCSIILDGTADAESLEGLSTALENLFYERLGMSPLEVLDEMNAQMSRKLGRPIDIADEFH